MGAMYEDTVSGSMWTRHVTSHHDTSRHDTTRRMALAGSRNIGYKDNEDNECMRKGKREKEGILDAVESVECPNHHDGNWNINATQRDAIARCYQIRRAPAQRRWKPGNRSIDRSPRDCWSTRNTEIGQYNTCTGIACSSDNYFVMFVCLHHRSCGPVKHCRVVEHSGKSRWSYITAVSFLWH